MMTSESRLEEAYVWIWLPGRQEPVVAGKLVAEGPYLIFNYGRSYLDREDAIPIEESELPLRPGIHPLLGDLHMPSCLRDAAPDAWGRRVIMNRLLGAGLKGRDTAEVAELRYLLESGSDRIGALDFQASPTEYVPRSTSGARLEKLLQAAEKVDQGLPLSSELDQALLHGSSIGGARPKALLTGNQRKYIAKFSSSSDHYNVVKGEFLAMRLARLAGLQVAPVELVRCLGRDVLLIERFDRVPYPGGWLRRHMVSALTLFQLDAMRARYASYEKLAEIIRHRFRKPRATLRELFGRLVFNILCGNTDDHARNHAAFWDGRQLELTPAYDICPQPRAGNEASQAMRILGGSNLSRIQTCLEAAPVFQLDEAAGRRIAEKQIQTIRDNWEDVCEQAELSVVERRGFWQRQFLNPFSVDGF